MWYTLKQITKMECGRNKSEHALYDMAETGVIEAVKFGDEYRMTEGQIDLAYEKGAFESSSLELNYDLVEDREKTESVSS